MAERIQSQDDGLGYIPGVGPADNDTMEPIHYTDCQNEGSFGMPAASYAASQAAIDREMNGGLIGDATDHEDVVINERIVSRILSGMADNIGGAADALKWIKAGSQKNASVRVALYDLHRRTGTLLKALENINGRNFEPPMVSVSADGKLISKGGYQDRNVRGTLDPSRETIFMTEKAWHEQREQANVV